ncbi:MAG TPA: phosphoketolase family protein [Streptosporangiaceae bacterium]
MALSADETAILDQYWRAANYLSAAQIYLLDNPLLGEPLRPDHIKPRLLGHWGTSPGLNFIWSHLNRVISRSEATMMYVIGPGHGGPAALACTWLDGTYSQVYPNVPQDTAGMKTLFRQFSFPGGVPSHIAPETPGSIHEGGELGYSLSHAFGAAFDNPELIVACVVGDGESETGPLATGWHGHRFLNPAGDGAVLPVLHLNGWKIANPALLARIGEEQLDALLRGYGWDPVYVTGDDPAVLHPVMAAALDCAVGAIRDIWAGARNGSGGPGLSARWPMIVMRTPKGWTGPKEVDGLPVEGTWRAHQVPLPEVRTNPDHLKQLEEWLRSYRPQELFDEAGAPRAELLGLVPAGDRRLGSSPHANGGLLLRDLSLPDFRGYAAPVTAPGAHISEPTRVLGRFLRDVMAANAEHRNFRVFGPDETASNRLEALYEATGKTWEEQTLPVDEHLAADGRVMEILSENYLLTSHVWRQDHNGFSHQDPGFIDHVVNKKAEVIRVYLPPDTNTLLSVADHCLRSRDYVNVIVAGKQPMADWLAMDAAVLHCTRGAGIWEWASTDSDGSGPDVVLACAGDVPTLEVLAAASVLREHLPDLRVRVVNVVDLMRLQPSSEHPHGMSDPEFDALFTTDAPVIFAYHGYPALIHRLTYRRTGHDNFHVRGYKEEGTTTTPFDMVAMNDMDRFHLVMDVIDRVPGLDQRAARLRQLMADTLIRHHTWTRAHGEDLPEVAGWTWPGTAGQLGVPR